MATIELPATARSIARSGSTGISEAELFMDDEEELATQPTAGGVEALSARPRHLLFQGRQATLHNSASTVNLERVVGVSPEDGVLFVIQHDAPDLDPAQIPFAAPLGEPMSHAQLAAAFLDRPRTEMEDLEHLPFPDDLY